jgi:hypothetical protein
VLIRPPWGVGWEMAGFWLDFWRRKGNVPPPPGVFGTEMAQFWHSFWVVTTNEHQGTPMTVSQSL